MNVSTPIFDSSWETRENGDKIHSFEKVARDVPEGKKKDSREEREIMQVQAEFLKKPLFQGVYTDAE